MQKVPLLDEHGQPLDVVAWLRACQGGTQSRTVAFAYQGHRFAGRLIASALPAEAAERARKKARRMASKQQRQVQEQTLFLAGWLLVFSSLPAARWSDAQVLALYRARWQVELLIKRMKSVLKLAQLRGKTALTNEATILALLVCWALQQQEAAQARDLLAHVRCHVAQLTSASAADGVEVRAEGSRAGESRCRTRSRTRRACAQQLGADGVVCADPAHGRPGGLDPYTRAGLPSLSAPFCV